MGPGGLSMGRKHLKFVQISRIQVVQLELHPFLTPSHLDRFPRNWFQDDHLVEVAELLQPVLAKYDVFDQSSMKNKDLRQFSQDCLVGPTVRLGFTLKQKAEHQSLLTSSRTCSGRKSARVKDIKVIIYVCPRLHGTGSNIGINSAFSQLLNGERKNDQGDISQYFHKAAEQKPVNNYLTDRSDKQVSVITSFTDSSNETSMLSTNIANMTCSSSSHTASRTGVSSEKNLAPPFPDISTSRSSSKTTVPSEPKPKTALRNLMTRRDQMKKSKQVSKPVKMSSYKKQTSSAPACTESHLGVNGKNGIPDIRCSRKFSLKDPCSDRRMIAEISDNDESSQDELPDLNENASVLNGHHKCNSKCPCPTESGASADVSLEGSLCTNGRPGDRHSLLIQESPLSSNEEQQRKSSDLMKEDCDNLLDSADSPVTNGKVRTSLKVRESNEEERKGRSGNDDELPDLDNYIYIEKKNNVICTTDIPRVKSGKESTSSESASSKDERKRDQVSRSLLLVMQCDSNELPDIALPKEILANDSDNQSRKKEITSSSKSSKFPFYHTSPDQQLEKSASRNNGRNNLKKQSAPIASRSLSSPPTGGPLKSSSPTTRSNIPPLVSSPSKTPTSSPMLRLIDVDFGFSSPETQKKKKMPWVEAKVTRKVVDSSCFLSTGDLKDDKKNSTTNGHCSCSSSSCLSCQSQQERSDSRMLPKLSLPKRQQRVQCTLTTSCLSDTHQSLRSHKKRSHSRSFLPAKDATPPVKKIKQTSPRKELEKADGASVKKYSQKQSSDISTKKSLKLKTSSAYLSSSSPSSPASMSRITGDVSVTKHSAKANEVSTSSCDKHEHSSHNLYLCTSPKDLSLCSPVPVSHSGLAATSGGHCSVIINELTCYPFLTESKKCTVTRQVSHSETPAAKCHNTDVLQSTLQIGSNHPQAASSLREFGQTSRDMALDTSESELTSQSLTRRGTSPRVHQKQHSPFPKVRITHCARKRSTEGDRSPPMDLTENSPDEESMDMTSVTERVSVTNRPKLSLTDTELEQKVLGMKEQLMSVSNGTMYSERHEQYIEGGISRSKLDHDSKLHLVKEGQEDVVMDVLMGIFGLESTPMMDYMLRVLLHEAIMRVYQQVTGHSC